MVSNLPASKIPLRSPAVESTRAGLRQTGSKRGGVLPLEPLISPCHPNTPNSW